MDLKRAHPDLYGGLDASGFSLDIIPVGNAYAIRAQQRAQPDLPPYYFVPRGQWEDDPLAFQKANVVAGALQVRDGRILTVEHSVEALSALFYDLLGLERAVRRYSDRYRSDVSRIVTTRVRVGTDELTPLDLFSGGLDDSVFVLLAPGGWGKTSFCRYVATVAAERLSPQQLVDSPFPVFVEFTREVEALPFDDLLRRFCTEFGLDANRAGGFAHLLRTGRAVLIVDGFDELASTFGLEKARLALERVLLEACAGQGRALVSSRTQFFELISRGRIIDGDLRETIVHLQPPDSLAVVAKRIGRRLSTPESDFLERYFADLPFELATSPLAAAWTADELEKNGLRGLEGSRTGIAFYGWYLRLVCAREESKRLARVYSGGEEQALDASSQLKWLRAIALAMLGENGYELRARTDVELAEFLSILLMEACVDVRVESGQEELLSHALFAPSVSGDDVGLEFVHPSIRDYFLAEALAEDSDNVPVTLVERPSPELARFVAEQSLSEAIATPVLEYLFERTTNPRLWRVLVAVGALQSAAAASQTAYQRGRLFQRIAGGASLDSLDLSGIDIRRADLRSTTLRAATLAGARFIDCDLASCDFREARLEETYFIGCTLSDARFGSGHASSGYIGDDEEDARHLRNDELYETLDALAAQPYRAVVDETSDAYSLGRMVGATMRYFVPRGRQPDRSVLRSTILKRRPERQWVNQELIPILMNRAEVLTVGRPQQGNESLYLNDIQRVVRWFEEPQSDVEVLSGILEELIGDVPSVDQVESFCGGLQSA